MVDDRPTADATVDWLLQGDPAVRWQAERDLADQAPSVWQATRRRVALEGWGARLLALRADNGTWGGGLYSPKWTSTFYTLRLLVQLGIDAEQPAAQDSCALLLERGVTPSGAALMAGIRSLT